MRVVLGVDGGNTKTDYFLHSLDGELIAQKRCGTCSHEALGMEGASREMGLRIGELLEGHDVQIAHAVFGLAGIDQSAQQAALTEICQRILGHDRLLAVNDSFLGIKAGLPQGFGVCSINGTGTAAGGVGEDGGMAQVGGMGFISGDDAGGNHIAARTLRAAYGAAFRFEPETILLPRVMARFGCREISDLQLMISTKFQFGHEVKPLEIIEMLFEAADEGDAVARGIILHTADSLARSAAGCAVRLLFTESVPVILIGSVWTRGRNRLMIGHFRERMEGYCGKSCEISLLEAPPAAGATLWALERARGSVPQGMLRERVLKSVEG